MTLVASTSLSLSAALVRCDDGSTWGPYTIEADAPRLGLIGAWGPLFELFSSQASVATGNAALLGEPVAQGLASGRVGVAPLDPPLVRHWTSERYLAESARLFGDGGGAASAKARTTLARFELSALARRTLGSLNRLERRLLVLARATLSEPALVCCEAPLDRLPDAEQATLLAALERAGEARKLLVSARDKPRLGYERALLASCQQLLWLDGGEVSTVALEQLEAGNAFEVLVSENPDVFERALADRGIVAERCGLVDIAYAYVYAHRDTHCVRFRVTLEGAEARRSLLEASEAAGAPLLELTSA
ncbi:MAG: hypothetical protein QM756_37860 [Polyangiaceae bacterium]